MDIQIRTPQGWIYVLPDTIENWAVTLGCVGPAEYHATVERAVKDGYGVSSEVKKMHFTWRSSGAKAIRKPQLTRTIDAMTGHVIPSRGEVFPASFDEVIYTLSSAEYKVLSIAQTITFKPELRMWLVSVNENGDQFIIQRSIGGKYPWSVYKKKESN